MTNLFKPKVELVQPVYPGFSSGGLSGSSAGGLGTVTSTAARNDVISGLSGAGESAANTFGDLYNTVKPGFNDLLNARLTQINDASRSAIGDLRTNLAARRIQGSSFGQSTIDRANMEFSRQRDQAIADNFLKSLEAQRQLTNDKFNASIQAFQPKLNELNLEAELAATLGTQGAQAIAHAAEFNAKAQSGANAAGLNSLGSILGTALGFGKSMFTGGFGGGGFGGDLSGASNAGWSAPLSAGSFI